jgi:uncharacterized phage infection (PIP) family protein YhgE
MRGTYLGAGAVVVAVLSAGCGKSPEQQQAEQLQKNAQQMAQNADQLSKQMAQSAGQMTKGAQDLASGFQAMARGMAAAATGRGDGKPVDPVDMKALQGLLPDVSGWERGRPRAERMTAPFPMSTASTRYTKGKTEISEKITDSGLNQLMLAPLTMMMTAGYQKETDSGFEKATTVAGYPAFEKWDSRDNRGELTLFVGQRYLVELRGSGLGDNKPLQEFAGHTDLKKLAALQ